MINLMPDNDKVEIRAARVNIVLARYIFVILIAFAFLVLLLATSYVVLTQTKNSAQQIIDGNATKAAVFSSTKAQIDTLSSSLSETKTILDQEVLYSNILAHIGQQMPEGTVIDKITLNAASFTGTPVALKIYAKTNEATVALRQKFQSTPLFSNVNFESVSGTSSGIAGYPVSVSLTLTLKKAGAQ